MKSYQTYTLESLLNSQLIEANRVSKSIYKQVTKEYSRITNNAAYKALSNPIQQYEAIKDLYNQNYYNRDTLLIVITMRYTGTTLTEISNDLNISKSTIQPILQGLAIDYPQILSVAFNKDLENINIKPV